MFTLNKQIKNLALIRHTRFTITWNALPKSMFRKLVDAQPNVMAEIIRKKGNCTR